MALLMLIVWGFVMTIFGIGSSFLFAMAGSIIFSLYIIYDTWRLANVSQPSPKTLHSSGNCVHLLVSFVEPALTRLMRSPRQVYGPDDYVLASIDLYLDVINLFVMLLQLFSTRD